MGKYKRVLEAGVLLLGMIGVGWVVSGGGKKIEPREKVYETIGSKAAKFEDKKGKKEETKFVTGRVEAWEPEGGVLIIAKVRTGERFSFKIDDKKANVITVEKGKKNIGFGVDRSSPHWATAFCKGDEVTAGVNEKDEVIYVNNQGYRICGLKE